jgi:hypothetical protein
VVRWKTVAIAGVALLAALTAGAPLPSCQALAQGSGCSESCQAAYGACYRSTANRAACEAQLQRCLHGCTGPRR